MRIVAERHETPDECRALGIQHVPVARVDDEKARARIGDEIARVLREAAHENHGPMRRIGRERHDRRIRKTLRLARVGRERTERAAMQ
jgi:hypothetical protein